MKIRSRKIVILKNDRMGDFIWSINAIKFLICNNPDKEVIIFLSPFNKAAKFFLNYKNVTVRIIGFNPSVFEKIYIFYFLATTHINDVYIFSPKFFYFLIPVFLYFKNINFYGYGVKNIKEKIRPNIFLSFFLKGYIINDRFSKKIRPHTSELQKKLVGFDDQFKLIDTYSKDLLTIHHKKYILFHFKKKVFDDLNWNFDILKKILSNILSNNVPVFLIKDLEISNYDLLFSKHFKSLNFDSLTKDKRLSNDIYFIKDVKNENFFKIIFNAKIVIAPHGTPTSLAFLFNVKTIDLFYFFFKNFKSNFYQAKNAFHEFKPKVDYYLFTTVNQNHHKTIRKINKLIQKLLQFV